jgi:hypothetical protein
VSIPARASGSDADKMVARERRPADSSHAWAKNETRDSEAPPRYRLALVTWVGVYAVMTFIFAAAGPAIAPWPLPLRTLVLSGLIVAALTWLVLPALMRLFRPWLVGKASSEDADARVRAVRAAPVGERQAGSDLRQLADSSHAVTSEDVFRLAHALREAKRAHAAALAELRQAGVDPVEDWAVWYAEYLLGVA